MISIPGQIPTTLIIHLSEKNKNAMEAFDELNEYWCIQNGIKDAKQQLAKLAKEYEEKLAKISETIKENQKRCGHQLVETHSDPTGGSDKSVVCQICDLEL